MSAGPPEVDGQIDRMVDESTADTAAPPHAQHAHTRACKQHKTKTCSLVEFWNHADGFDVGICDCKANHVIVARFRKQVMR